ncbi:hypothetical protein BC941DRAFT_519150 [Chlamydoabsidia padenii]|nr:hypothetical protein BC941DRAFT_519150 [Chlamydoabsidia padenii]
MKDVIVEKMKDHYCRHPIFQEGHSNFSQEEYHVIAGQLHRQSAQEMYIYCTNNDIPDVWGYLYTLWYRPDEWRKWARSCTFLVRNGKSTMMMESHWKVLKRNHLYHYNRPRMDLLTYIITDKFVKHHKHSYEQKVVLRRDVFSWEREFVKTWNHHHRQAHDVPGKDY